MITRTGSCELPPPLHVGQVAERAAHRDACTLVGLGAGWATTGTSTPKTGVRTVVPNSGLIALVVGMRDQGDARRDQLGPGGLDVDGPPAGPPEPSNATR